MCFMIRLAARKMQKREYREENRATVLFFLVSLELTTCLTDTLYFSIQGG